MGEQLKGRPSTFSQELADDICGKLADGKSLRSICREEDMPATSTVCKWLGEKSDFSEQYARAREMQADAIFDDVLDIADQYDQEKEKLEGGTDHIQRAKLRIDARKWMAGKLRPKKYGDRQHLEHMGEGGGPMETKAIATSEADLIEQAKRLGIDPVALGIGAAKETSA